MRPLLEHLGISLRLHFRNRMALLYGYLFPTIFLIAFWTLYRFDQVPLIRHVGEFLTISVLGGACFGLPTTMVAERERGVWRRYRVAPVSTATLVGSTVAARYLLLLTAGLLQLALAMGLGMPLPRHPFQLAVAFTFTAFAFIGIGLVIAMLADNVPAVQALGQCIFLPMLIIGGVAVPLESLPAWAERLSAFFPGRYAVQAMQVTANGQGLRVAEFSLMALASIGAAGCLAAARLFRWDREQRFAAQTGKAWVGVALAAWVAVGIAAEARARLTRSQSTASTRPGAAQPAAGVPEPPPAPTDSAPTMSPAAPAAPPPSTATGRAPAASPSARAPIVAGSGSPARSVSPAAPPPAAPPPSPQPDVPLLADAPSTWQAVTRADIERDLTFDRLPRDTSIVTPIAVVGHEPDQELAETIAALGSRLPSWPPGQVSDPVQRARNLLSVAGVIDVAQSPMEPFVPAWIYDELRRAIPEPQLIQVLYWIAIHPDGGTVPPAADYFSLGIQNVPADVEEIRNRTAIYGVKLLGRLTGYIR
jgi:ABC-2 type transport system permease protein